MSSSDSTSPASNPTSAKLGAAVVLGAVVLAIALAAVAWKGPRAVFQQRDVKAEAQVARVVEDLDRRTTSTGVYDRTAADAIHEVDPWRTPLKVVYSQDGVSENVVVSSAGPDRTFHTDDDISRQGIAINLRGVGIGVKQNAEETASNVARGLVRGTVDGVKQSVKEAVSKRDDAEESANDAK